eukprot:6552865-Pyramimonas_sp.AAC.2
MACRPRLERNRDFAYSSSELRDLRPLRVQLHLSSPTMAGAGRAAGARGGGRAGRKGGGGSPRKPPKADSPKRGGNRQQPLAAAVAGQCAWTKTKFTEDRPATLCLF